MIHVQIPSFFRFNHAASAWRIHCGVEVTELSTNKQHTLSMMMSCICSCRNKIGAELHIYLQEGSYRKRLFRGSGTNYLKK
jgi:hypothetical protein